MKKLYIVILLLIGVSFVSKAQIFFEEGFEIMPPVLWTIDLHPSNWDESQTNNAGGTAPEGMFQWDPSFIGDSYLYSFEVDLTGYTQVAFSFKQMVDHYGGSYTIGVATRSGGGTWNTVWELVNPPANVPAEEVEITIANGDVGQADFQIAFFFSGDSYNINNWYFDDAKLFVPFDHDAATVAILGDTYFDAGDEYITNALIKNKGLNEETFDIVLEITDATTDGILYTETVNTTLAAGVESTYAFGGYVLPYENFMYEVIVYTALVGDEDPSNDMKNRFIYTYTSERGMVLLEIGTGTWCQFCPGSAMGADDLIDNGKNVAVIENHNGDAYTNDYSNARNTYYGITGYPTAVFDGVEKVVGGSNTATMYPTYLPIFEARAEIRSAFAVELYGENVGGNDYNLTGVINKLGPTAVENVVLHIVLTESHIIESWQGQDHLNFVTRLMMPDENGTVVDVLGNDYIEVNETFQIDAGWETDECELVYFLQNTDTKEILQGGKVMVTDLNPVGIEEDLAENGVVIRNIYPNPFSNETNISFSLTSQDQVNVSVHDMTGRVVAELANEEMAAGDHQLVWDAGSEMPNGIYFCTISTANYKLTQKVMLAK
jgi:hypothetical protein